MCAKEAQFTSYKVFLNRNEDSFWGFKPEHELEQVYAGSVEGTLDTLWGLFNRGSGTFVGDDLYPHRSLSVGDVVEFDGTRYAVEGVGWKELS